jgi:AraC family transcriptional regulator
VTGEPRIEAIGEKRLIGLRTTTSAADDGTGALWRAFMPRRRELVGVVGDELYAVDVFPAGYFAAFDPRAGFEKWAAVEVSPDQEVPGGMSSLTLPAGLYAVFPYRGPASEGEATYRYIHETWLPASDFVLADRPHFAVMDERYRGEDPDSEEEIWIPVEAGRSGPPT